MYILYTHDIVVLLYTIYNIICIGYHRWRSLLIYTLRAAGIGCVNHVETDRAIQPTYIYHGHVLIRVVIIMVPFICQLWSHSPSVAPQSIAPRRASWMKITGLPKLKNYCLSFRNPSTLTSVCIINHLLCQLWFHSFANYDLHSLGLWPQITCSGL